MLTFRRSAAPAEDEGILRRQVQSLITQRTNLEADLADMGRLTARLTLLAERQTAALESRAAAASRLAEENQQLRDDLARLEDELRWASSEAAELRAAATTKPALTVTAQRVELRRHPAVQVLLDSPHPMSFGDLRATVKGGPVTRELVDELLMHGIITQSGPVGAPVYAASAATRLTRDLASPSAVLVRTGTTRPGSS